MTLEDIKLLFICNMNTTANYITNTSQKLGSQQPCSLVREGNIYLHSLWTVLYYLSLFLNIIRYCLLFIHTNVPYTMQVQAFNSPDHKSTIVI